MAIDIGKRQEIKENIKKILKLKQRISDKRKDILRGDSSPFLKALIGNNMTLTAKIVQSLQTTIGMGFYEQTCKILGESHGYTVHHQKKVLGDISQEAEDYLHKLNDLDYTPNRRQELIKIREICKKNFNARTSTWKEYPDSTVDVYVITPNGTEFLIDITTVKPNKKDFRTLKEKTLRWAAYRMSQNPEVQVEPFFAIPYNPETIILTDTTYTRWHHYYDREDILVGDQLWKKVSGNNCSIKDIVGIFEELSQEIGDSIAQEFENL